MENQEGQKVLSHGEAEISLIADLQKPPASTT